MSFKTKIIARLKEKFPKANLSQKRIDVIAEKLDKRVTEESQIDEQLDLANELTDFEAIAKEDDRVRGVEARLQKLSPTPAPAKTEVETTIETTTTTDDVPAWAKTLIEQNKTLANEVNSLKSGKTTDTRKTVAQEKLKDLHPDFVATTLNDMPLINFETDEAFTGWLDRKVTEGAKLTQTAANEALAGEGRPLKSQAPDGKTQASKEELDAVMSKIL